MFAHAGEVLMSLTMKDVMFSDKNIRCDGSMVLLYLINNP